MATLTAKAPTGGKNRVFCFTDSSGSAGTLAFTFDRTETSEIVGDVLLDAIELSIANKIRNEAFLAFKQSNLSKVNLGQGEQVYEDGNVSSLVNVPAGVSKLHVVHLDGEIDGKIMVTYFRGILAPDTGNHSRSSGSLGDTPVKFIGIPASQVMTLPIAKIIEAGSDIFLNTASLSTMSFNTSQYGCVKYMSVT